MQRLHVKKTVGYEEWHLESSPVYVACDGGDDGKPGTEETSYCADA